MKKIIALFLVVGMTAALFASCSGNTTETTTNTTGTTETTTGTSSTESSTTTESTASGETEATTNSSEETTTEGGTTEIPVQLYIDKNPITSADYDYEVYCMKDFNTKKVVGVAICKWNNEKATSSIVFDSQYRMKDGTICPVLQIGGETGGILNFQGQLESLTIPSSVTRIGKKAFVMCTNLKTLNLSEGLESIGEMAFWNCNSLETLTIPSTVTTIDRMAFANCVNLTSVTLPRCFEGQIAEIFEGCTNATFTFID